MADSSTSLQRIARLAGAILLVAGGAYLFVVGLGTYSLWDPWEPRYAEAVREMSARGDYLTPYLGGRVRWTKPILVYWAMLVTTSLGGDTEFAARLPSALAAIGCLLIVYVVVGRLRGYLVGFIAAAILATIPQFYFMARQAMPDMLLTLGTTSALGFAALGLLQENPRRSDWLFAYAGLAVAVLAKGPVAGVIVLTCLAVFWLLEGAPWPVATGAPRTAAVSHSARHLVAKTHLFAGTGVFLLIAGPWYLGMLQEHGYTFVDSFIRGENLHRFAEPVRGLRGDVTYYLRTMAHGMYPWSAFLPLGLLLCFTAGDAGRADMSQRRFFAAWLVAVLLVFTTAGSKLEHYILPLTPAVAILAAFVWEEFLRGPKPTWFSALWVLSIPLALLPVRDFLIQTPEYVLDSFSPRDQFVGTADGAVWRFAVAWALVMLLALVWRRSRLVVALALVVTTANAAYMSHVVLPRQESVRTLRAYVDRYQANADDRSVLIHYGALYHSVVYYAGADGFHHFDGDALEPLLRFLADKEDVFIIAHEDLTAELARRLEAARGAPWHLLSEKHPRFVLLSAQRPVPD